GWGRAGGRGTTWRCTGNWRPTGWTVRVRPCARHPPGGRSVTQPGCSVRSPPGREEQPRDGRAPTLRRPAPRAGRVRGDRRPHPGPQVREYVRRVRPPRPDQARRAGRGRAVPRGDSLPVLLAVGTGRAATVLPRLDGPGRERPAVGRPD